MPRFFSSRSYSREYTRCCVCFEAFSFRSDCPWCGLECQEKAAKMVERHYVSRFPLKSPLDRLIVEKAMKNLEKMGVENDG